MRELYLPSDPLHRFFSIYDALMAKKTWTMTPQLLRHAAMTLITTPGQASTLAHRTLLMGKKLKEQAGWSGQLTSPIRFIIAAQLLRADEQIEGFAECMQQERQKFRSAGLRRGNIFEFMAIHILRLGSGHRGITPGTINRFHDIYEAMKSNHWWLTGPDDYPACAMLTLRDENVASMGRRIEELHCGLRTRLPNGDQLQLASHILYLSPLKARDVVTRFFGIHDACLAANIRMWQTDYDELAILSFLDQDPKTIVAKLVDHRAQMKDLRPRVDAVASFNLASNTTFLELANNDQGSHQAASMSHLLSAQAAIAAQQAAACATITATTAATTHH